MLLVYLEPFDEYQIQQLQLWSQWVRYWPRSWVNTEVYNAAIPADWWLLFSNPWYSDLWLLQYPEQSRIIRTLLD
jgi:hypothetical protein